MQHGNRSGYLLQATAISYASAAASGVEAKASGPNCSAMNLPISAVSGIISPVGSCKTGKPLFPAGLVTTPGTPLPSGILSFITLHSSGV
eukprot:Skav236115  [mRNA]  locus=scaffold1166:458656:461606:- [translate_table: standard]